DLGIAILRSAIERVEHCFTADATEATHGEHFRVPVVVRRQLGELGDATGATRFGTRDTNAHCGAVGQLRSLGCLSWTTERAESCDDREAIQRRHPGAYYIDARGDS